MKKILLLLFCGLGIGQLMAQQDGQYTQFFRSRLNYNAAFAGSGGGSNICVGLIGRSQWLGFGSSDKGQSPNSFTGDIHAPLLKGKLGVGLNITGDEQGHETTLTPTFNVAYHQTFSNQHKMSFGVGVGFIQKSLDGTKLKAYDQGDQYIPTELVNGSSLDLNAGIYYQIPTISVFRDVYAGVGLNHLNQAKVEYGNSIFNADLHVFFMTGAVYDLNSSFTIEPNIFVKNAVKVSADINVMTTYNGSIMGGLTYRNTDAAAILAGYKFSSKNSLMMSYDITTSKLSQYSNGTIELSYRHCFGIKIEPPVKTIRPIYTQRFL